MRTIFGRLRGVSPALDGAFVEVDQPYYREGPNLCDEDGLIGQGPTLCEVKRFGGMPVEPQTIFLHPDVIEEIGEAPVEKELGTGSPYGKFIDSFQWADETGVLSCSIYEQCVHLNLRRGHLVDDTVCWDRTEDDLSLRAPVEEIKEYQRTGREVVDFVFRMRELKKGRD
jgi:hypothetical protein